MGVSNSVAFGKAGMTNNGGGISDIVVAKGGGKTPIAKAYNSVVQVDIKRIAALYQEGAAAQEEYYKKGLQYYTDAIGVAVGQLTSGYEEANITLQPLSKAGSAALGEQMKMLGLSPVSATIDYYSKLNNLKDASGNDYAVLQKQLQDTEKLKTPEERAAGKQAVLDSIDAALYKKGSAKDQIAALGDAPPDPGPPPEPVKGHNVPVSVYRAREAAAEQWKEKVSNRSIYDSKVDAINKETSEAEGRDSQLKKMMVDYQSNYSTDFQGGYTGDQIEERLSSTPGYQFQLEGGTEAIARQQAAVGMLGSGNTGAALLEYGQGLAMNSYNNYMTNLSNIANMGSQATIGISNNQIGYGQDISQLSTLLGGAGAQTYQGIGDAINAAKVNEANTRAQVAMFNAQMQYNSKQANLSGSRQASQAAIAATPGIMNASTNAQVAQYGIFQGQNRANSYAANFGATGQPSGAWSVPTPQQAGWIV